MSCIAIQLDRNEPITVALDKLGYLHVVSVAGGNVWIMAGSPDVDGAFTSYKWPELPIKDSSQVLVYLEECSEGTAPSTSEDQTISELEKRIKETSEKLKHFEEAASQVMETTDRPDENESITSSIQVFRESQPVFNVSGEHIQFEVNWKVNTEPKISVWAFDRNEDDSPKDHFASNLNGQEKYILRFGS